MDSKEIGWKGVDWINLSWEKIQELIFVNVDLNLRVA